MTSTEISAHRKYSQHALSNQPRVATAPASLPALTLSVAPPVADFSVFERDSATKMLGSAGRRMFLGCF